MLNGQDLKAYIVSENDSRRHMTKGQRAMAVAKILPEKGRGKTPKNLGFHAEYLRNARTVLDYAPELADSVLAGSPLNDAYKTALQRKQAAESSEATSWS